MNKKHNDAKLSEDARREWLDAMRDVEPYLQAYADVRLPEMKSCRPTMNAPSIQQPPRIDMPVQMPPMRCGGGDGLDRGSLRRLKRGQIPIDVRLDLHGLTQKQAYDALHKAVYRAVMRAQRLMLVITGKGGAVQKGVLRSALPRWVNESSLRPYIVAFDSARAEDGGLGAYYLLLKRERQPQNDDET